MYKYILLFSVIFLSLNADVVSSSPQTAISTAGSSFTISGGDIKGKTSIFSFKDFNLNKEQSATFLDKDFTHSIARVTGEDLSLLDGKLKSSAKNFYFLNPNGVIFGENVQLDLAGSFHVSTADYLELEDGKRIYANTNDLDFSSAAPESFGFLEDSKFAPVTIESSVNTPNSIAQIEILKGDLNIVAGDIIFTEGTVPKVATTAVYELSTQQTLAPDGNRYYGYDEDLNLYYIDIESNKLFTNDDVFVRNVVEGVDYQLQDAYARLHTEADPLTHELISSEVANQSETFEAYSVYVPILDDNSNPIPLYNLLPNVIKPNIYVHTGDLSLSTVKSAGSANINTHTTTAKDMGTITLSSSYIYTNATMLFQANNITLDASSIVSSSTAIEIPNKLSFEAKNDIHFNNGSSITSSLQNGATAASTINIVSGNLISFSGSNPLSKEGSYIYSNSAFDNSASSNIYMNSQNIELQNGTKITTTGYNQADSGSIVIQAKDHLEISGVDTLQAVSTLVTGADAGRSGDILLNAKSMTLDKGNILSSVYLDGKKVAGEININVEDKLSILGDSSLRVSSNPNERTSLFAQGSIFAVNYSSAKGPNVTINAGSIVMNQFTLSQTSGPNLFLPKVSGEVGDLTIKSDSISMSNGSIFNSNNGYTLSGLLEFGAMNISLENMQLFAQSYNDAAEAGTYVIGSDKTNRIDLKNTKISTQSTKANGGSISILATNTIALDNSELVTEVKGGEGSGGNINVISDDVASFNSSILNANAYGGAGGNLLIQSGDILKSLDSTFTASSALGVDGNIDFSGNLIEENLISNQVHYGLLDLSGWSNIRCDTKDKSTFFIELADMYEQKCSDLTYINFSTQGDSHE